MVYTYVSIYAIYRYTNRYAYQINQLKSEFCVLQHRL